MKINYKQYEFYIESNCKEND